MLKFKDFKVNEDYNPSYHSKIDTEFVEDVYQYLLDIGFRLDEYEHDNYDDDGDEDDNDRYGKAEFKNYLLSHGEYGFKTAKGKSITDNVVAGSLPALGLKFTKKFEVGGENEKAVKSFSDISAIYKEISGIVSKLNKKSLNVDIKQSIYNGLLSFTFTIMDKEGKVKAGDINFRTAKIWKEISYSIDISEDLHNDNGEDIDFHRTGELGRYDFIVNNGNYQRIHRNFTDEEFEEFKLLINQDSYRGKGLTTLLSKYKLTCTITPAESRRFVTLTFADDTTVKPAAKKGAKKAARKKKEYKDSEGTVLAVGDTVKLSGNYEDITATIISFRGDKAKIEDEDEDTYSYDLDEMTKVVD